jgi:predicted anti-sigma-YlaC factor YlaD
LNCRKIIIALSEYLDGALDPILKTSIEIHLAKCEDCRLVVDTTRHTIEIYCKSEPAPLPPPPASASTKPSASTSTPS